MKYKHTRPLSSDELEDPILKGFLDQFPAQALWMALETSPDGDNWTIEEMYPLIRLVGGVPTFSTS
jgi:hypothetical protein